MHVRPTEVTWQELDGSVVVLDLKAGVYLEINVTGSLLFKKLVDGASVGELIAVLTGTFDLPPEEAQKDVDTFLDTLRQRSLLVE